MCDGTKHNLMTVYRESNWDCDNVVRWCRDCGAVVVDVDYDGRVMPGKLMKMIFPTGEREK